MKHSSRLSNIHIYLVNVDVTMLELMLYQISGLIVYFYPIIETFSNVALVLAISILFCIFTSAEAVGESNSNSTASNAPNSTTQPQTSASLGHGYRNPILTEGLGRRTTQHPTLLNSWHIGSMTPTTVGTVRHPFSPYYMPPYNTTTATHFSKSLGSVWASQIPVSATNNSRYYQSVNAAASLGAVYGAYKGFQEYIRGPAPFQAYIDHISSYPRFCWVGTCGPVFTRSVGFGVTVIAYSGIPVWLIDHTARLTRSGPYVGRINKWS